MIRICFALSYLFFAGDLFAVERAEFKNHGRLKVTDGKITSEAGEIVTLQGGAMMDGLAYNYSKQTVEYLKAKGANLVRIPLSWGRSGLSQSYEEHWNRFKEIADWAVEMDLYFIADFHAVASPKQSQLKETSIRFFTDVAKTYGSSGLVIYELLNEAPGKSSYSSYVPWSEIKEYSEEIIDVIRSIDPQSLIIVGPPNWSQQLEFPLDDPVERENLAYSLHFYSTLHLFDERLNELAESLPIIVTEWAAQTPENSTGEIDFESLNQYVDWMNEYNISWAAWSFSDELQPYGWFYPGAFADRYLDDSELRPWGSMVLDLLDDRNLNKTVGW